KCTVRAVQMRKAVSIVEARRELGRLAEEVRRTGQSVAITRRGRVIARIAPEPGRGGPRRGTRGEMFDARQASRKLIWGGKALDRDIRDLRREFAAALSARVEAFGRPPKRS